jgi:hypothetical protein
LDEELDMRRTWIVSLALLFVVWGCKDKTPGGRAAGQPYVVRQVQGPLSSEDIRAAFHALGLQVEHFDCFLPQGGQLHLSVRRYVDGQLAATPGRSATGVASGRRRFLLFTHKQKSSLSFTFTCGGAAVSWGQIDIGGYRASTSHVFEPATLEPGKEVPLYAYLASNGDLATSSATSAEQFIAQYPLAIVVSAEWQPYGGQ